MESTPPSSLDLDLVEIKPLDSSMSRAAFCCGNKTIDNFFRNNARDNHDKHKARVYVALYEGAVAGYYYLVAQSQNPDHVSKEAQDKFGRVAAAPCVYLGMLGVEGNFQKNGLGRVLMVHAMGRTLEVANLVGIYALTLEAVDQETAEFYKKLGFDYFVEGELRMFLPIQTIKQILQPTE